MQIIEYNDKYRDDMIFMVLQAKDALGIIPRLHSDLLDVNSSYIANGDMFYLATDDKDRVVGCLGYNRLNSTQAKLHRFYVKAELKNHGIGTALLERCEADLKGLCFKEVLSHTADLGAFSNTFFIRKGYVEYQSGWMKKVL